MTEERLVLADLLEKAGDGDFLRAVAEAVLQLLMESDVEGMIGAGRYERSGERTTWRNGYRDRSLDTRLGALQLRMLMGLTSTIMVGHLGSAALASAGLGGRLYFTLVLVGCAKRSVACTLPVRDRAGDHRDRASWIEPHHHGLALRLGGLLDDVGEADAAQLPTPAGEPEAPATIAYVLCSTAAFRS
jgi:hypothetical protein